MLISPDELVAAGYLSKKDLTGAPKFPNSHVDYPAVTRFKYRLLRRAFNAFSETSEYSAFMEANSWWIRAYVAFMALLHENRGKPWNKFDPRRKPLEKTAKFHSFLQFEFFRQWRKLRAHCQSRGIRILGDLPFYVEYNSADVWSNPALFDLDDKNEMRSVGGVPPDYFSRDGQRWGSPTYRWARIAEQGYRGWIDRFRFAFQHLDLLRVDHFRGFEAFWSVPAKDKTARNGKWIPGPGAALFHAVQRELGDAAIIAENLGVINREVEALRNEFGFPGLAVLQFGFGADAVHYPENYTQHTVAFTGTHDNNTINGWWSDLLARARDGRDTGAKESLLRAEKLFQTRGSKVHWHAIETLLRSNAALAIFPLQDVLGLGGTARMNFPGKQRGNWSWRVEARQLQSADFRRLCALTESSGRAKSAG
ncbi:MAG: 4-alpha-glucanotransferase [Candidatus Acidiferrum sp.]